MLSGNPDLLQQCRKVFKARPDVHIVDKFGPYGSILGTISYLLLSTGRMCTKSRQSSQEKQAPQEYVCGQRSPHANGVALWSLELEAI